MANRKVKKSSPLDDITPERWTFSDEVIELLTVLEKTVELTPLAADLVDRVLAGPLIDSGLIPVATEEERKAPT